MAAMEIRLQEVPKDEERANKELERTKGAMPVDAAPFAAQFQRSPDRTEREDWFA